MNFNVLQFLSLQAQYKMENVTGKEATGDKANFTIDLPLQHVSYITKTKSFSPQLIATCKAEFIQEGAMAETKDAARQIDGVVLRQDGFLSATGERKF
jgi:hypothetical protein